MKGFDERKASLKEFYKQKVKDLKLQPDLRKELEVLSTSHFPSNYI